ncbi:MAG: hypothetical protein O2955_01740 [Planctomycetota bacterium]|nr:hypothetical protein [Planctomycetota bacterium]MDA1211205.1 hypothetical protein [Planctomycetota bacterium]
MYPAYFFEPVDFLEFIYTPIFDRVWRQIGLNDDQDRFCLEAQIMMDPKGPPIISGTGGARKTRFSPPGWPIGKSGALRIVYKHFDEFHVSAIGLVYPKGVRDNLSHDQKVAIKKALDEIEEELKR